MRMMCLQQELHLFLDSQRRCCNATQQHRTLEVVLNHRILYLIMWDHVKISLLSDLWNHPVRNSIPVACLMAVCRSSDGESLSLHLFKLTSPWGAFRMTGSVSGALVESDWLACLNKSIQQGRGFVGCDPLTRSHPHDAGTCLWPQRVLAFSCPPGTPSPRLAGSLL